MPPKIERVPLHELQPGQLADFFVVLSERAKKATREGKPFYSLKFRDRHRTVSVPVWENSPLFEMCDQEWNAGQHFKVRAVYQEHDRYGPQLDIQNIRLANSEDWMDGYDPEAFVVSTRFDVESLFSELMGFAQGLADKPLRQLVVNLLSEHEEAIKQHPAASRNHHNYRGGYLEHTVSVVRTGEYLANKYRDYYPELKPPLNKDLIIAGCILHDIGKLHELAWVNEDPVYTVAGNLIGHILIGRNMVRDAAKLVPDLNPELLLYLEHIITSHQGLPEWGSPKSPMFPEALLVHFADDIDAKMNMFVSIIESSAGDGPFTDQANIFRRKLLKGRQV